MRDVDHFDETRRHTTWLKRKVTIAADHLYGLIDHLVSRIETAA